MYALGQVATKETIPGLEGLPTVTFPEKISAAIQRSSYKLVCFKTAPALKATASVASFIAWRK